MGTNQDSRQDAEIAAINRDVAMEEQQPIYKIVRHYLNHDRERTVRTGLTLAEAQAHCSDPETTSKTAVGVKARVVTDRWGPWFDGYALDIPKRRRRR